MEFKSIVINSLILGLFIVSLFMFSAQFALEQNTNQTIASSESLSRLNTSLQSKLNTAETNVNSSQNSYVQETSNPTVTALGFYFRSIIDAGTTYFSIAIGMFNTITLPIQENLGVPPIVSGTILTIVIILVILGVWSVLRAGR